MDEINQKVDEEMNALAAHALADQEEVTKTVYMYSKLKAKGMYRKNILYMNSTRECSSTLGAMI